jgi:hypothetical protein
MKMATGKKPGRGVPADEARPETPAEPASPPSFFARHGGLIIPLVLGGLIVVAMLLIRFTGT